MYFYGGNDAVWYQLVGEVSNYRPVWLVAAEPGADQYYAWLSEPLLFWLSNTFRDQWTDASIEGIAQLSMEEIRRTSSDTQSWVENGRRTTPRPIDLIVDGHNGKVNMQSDLWLVDASGQNRASTLASTWNANWGGAIADSRSEPMFMLDGKTYHRTYGGEPCDVVIARGNTLIAMTQTAHRIFFGNIALPGISIHDQAYAAAMLGNDSIVYGNSIPNGMPKYYNGQVAGEGDVVDIFIRTWGSSDSIGRWWLLSKDRSSNMIDVTQY
jgi:hypothetical protein